MATRPLHRAVKLYNLFDVIMDGRYVMVPAVGYEAKWGSFPTAEKAFASIVAGTVQEYETSPSLALKTALRLAVANTEFDPEFYLVRSTEGSKSCHSPYGETQRNPYLNYHAARVRTPGSIRKGTYRTKTIKHGIQLIIGKLKATLIRKPKKGTGSRVRDPMVVQAYHFPKSKFTPAKAKAWLKKYNVKITLFEPARKKAVAPKKRKKTTPQRRHRAA